MQIVQTKHNNNKYIVREFSQIYITSGNIIIVPNFFEN